MLLDRLQQCRTEEEVHALVGSWVARAFRAAEKKKRAWNKKARDRINQIREQTSLPIRKNQ